MKMLVSLQKSLNKEMQLWQKTKTAGSKESENTHRTKMFLYFLQKYIIEPITSRTGLLILFIIWRKEMNLPTGILIRVLWMCDFMFIWVPLTFIRVISLEWIVPYAIRFFLILFIVYYIYELNDQYSRVHDSIRRMGSDVTRHTSDGAGFQV